MDHPAHVPGRFEAAAAPSCCAFGDARRGPKWPESANYPAFGGGSTPRAHRRRPWASGTPAGALKTALYMYQVCFMQQPHRHLCPGRCTRRRPNTLPPLLNRRPVPTAGDPSHLTHLSGPWGPLCTCTRLVSYSHRLVVCALGNAPRGAKCPKKRPIAPLSMLDRCLVPPSLNKDPRHLKGPGNRLVHMPVGSKQPPPRRVVPLAMHVEEPPKKANSATSGAGLALRAFRQRPKESDTPAGALGTALYTYRVGFMQPPPRRLCPGRCTQLFKIYVKAAS
jgi:hypothetical protein